MHPSKLKVIADRLEYLGGKVAQNKHAGNIQDHYLFETEDTDILRKLLDEINGTEPWKSSYTRNEMLQLIHRLIRDVSLGITRENLEDSLIGEEQKLFNLPDYLFILPVQGIYVRNGVIDIGNIKLEHLSTEKIEPIVRNYLKSERAILEAVKILKGFENITVSFYKAKGSEERVRHDAVRQTRVGLQILRGLTMLTHAQPRDVEIAVSGDERIGLHAGILLHSDSMSISQRALEKSWIDDLTIDIQYLEEFNNIGLEQLRAILALSPSDRSIWQQSLLRSYEWISNAQTQQDPESAFLMLAVVLEILFTDQGPVGETIADAVAFLTAKDVANRLIRRKQVKKLYDLRSKITHGRTAHPVEWKDVDELRNVLREALQAVILVSIQWTTREDLRKYLEQVKYS